MKNKIYALLIVSSLFLSVNGITMSANNKELKVGEIKFTHLQELPEDFLSTKLPIKTGEEYSNKKISDIYLALKKLDYIENVNIYPVVNGNRVNIKIEIDEVRGALDLAKKAEMTEDLSKKTEFTVASVDVVGLNIINKNDVLKDFPIKSGDEFIPQSAIDGGAKIFQQGYFSSVEPKVDRRADNTVAIVYEVVENPIVRDVKISGNTLFTEKELVGALGVEKGKILNGNLLNPDDNGVINTYRKLGYTLARVETIDVTEEGDVSLSLTEGVVESVKFKKQEIKRDNERKDEYFGKLKTQPYVFERSQMIKPGEIFKIENVEATIKELYRTGIFNSIEPIFLTSELNPNARAVEFIVDERPTTTINGSISYGTSVGLVGGIKLADSNFLGKGQEAVFNIEASNKGDKTFELSLFDPWIKGTERVQAGGSIYWRESKDEDAKPDEVELVKRMGTRWTIGKGLNDKIYARLATRLDKYKEVRGDKIYNDKYDLLAVTPMLMYDSRDNSYNPTKGIYSTISYEYGDLLKDTRKYHQLEADLRAYHPTFFKDKNVMAYRVVWGRTGKDTPEALRFSVGGAETIRGYDYGKFDGFDKFHATIENRTQINKGLQFVTFFDIGNAWQNVERDGKGRVISVSPDRKGANGFKELKKGYGVGVRIDTPMGPLRFDYGWPLDPLQKGKEKTSGRFYFSFGQTF